MEKNEKAVEKKRPVKNSIGFRVKSDTDVKDSRKVRLTFTHEIIRKGLKKKCDKVMNRLTITAYPLGGIFLIFLKKNI